MHWEIVEKPAFDVIEKVEIHTTENGQNTKSVPAFWDRAHADGTVNTLLGLAGDSAFMYGICYDNATEGKCFEYAIAVASNAQPPKGYRKKTIPARTWAVFPCKGAVAHSIQDTWQKIYKEFLPHSDYRTLREMDVEAYPDGDTGSEDYYCEIWLPVVKK